MDKHKACGFRRGGMVPGKGNGDTVPAMLTPGEFVMPKDSVASIGIDKLEAMRQATHGRGFKGGAKGKSGRAHFYDGGLVTEEDKRKTGSMDTEPAAPTMSYGDQMRNVGGFLANAAGGVLKTVVSAPGYGLNSPSLQAAAPPATAATSSPVATAPAAGFSPARDSQAANTTPSTAPVPAATTAPAAAPTTTALDGGITKTMGADGRTLYSNVGGTSDATLMARGMPSARNTAAADALDARYRTEAAALAARDAAPGPQVMVANIAPLGFKAEPSSGSSPSTSGISSREAARLATQREIAAANNTTQRYGYDTNAATATRGQDLQAGATAARLGFDQAEARFRNPLTVAQTQEAQQRVAAQSQLQGAQQAYTQALATGDQKKIDAAENNLRGITGRWEKTYPDMFSTTTVGGGIDPLTGMARPSSLVVTDKRTGATRVVSGAEIQGGAQPQAAKGISRAEYDKLPKGASYVGPDGKQYIKG